MLSHIKAPLREEKREVASYPKRNLAKLRALCKRLCELTTFSVAARPVAGDGGKAFQIQAQFFP